MDEERQNVVGAQVVGRRIKEGRQALGYKSQRHLANFLGIRQQTLSSYERGRTEAPYWFLEKLGHMGVNVRYLLTGDGEPIQSWIGDMHEGLRAMPYLGQVPAGELAEIFEFRHERMYEPGECSEGTFATSVRGSSMEPFLLEGDVVIVDPAREAKSGDIALVRAGGEVTVKKIVVREDMLILQPFNSYYEPIVLTKKDGEVAIIGAVIRLIRDM